MATFLRDSVMMVLSAQFAEGRGAHALLLSLYLAPPLQLLRPLHPLPSKITLKVSDFPVPSQDVANPLPLSPSLWS